MLEVGNLTTKAHLTLSNDVISKYFTAIIFSPSQMIISCITPYVTAELTLDEILMTLPAFYSTPRTATEWHLVSKYNVIYNSFT